MQGLDLMASAKQGRAEKLTGRAVVIGGGNAAVDTAQIALRLGAEKVNIISLEDREDLPVFEEELLRALRDGINLECGRGVDHILEHDGKVSGVVLSRCLSVFDQDGCFLPSFDCEDTITIKADHVIVSIGQTGDTLNWASADEMKADPLTLQTRREKVFLAGDCFSGPSSVIRAMGSGRQAAVSIDRFLKGEHLKFNRAYAGPVVTEFDIDTSKGSEADRVIPLFDTFKDQSNFNEAEHPYTTDQARIEAGRCYSCGIPFGQYRTCWFCLPCEVECPEEALWVEVPYLLR
jgi:NADPH-dependent glutamate synthase beta subunit-like oxidoreductase